MNNELKLIQFSQITIVIFIIKRVKLNVIKFKSKQKISQTLYIYKLV